MKWTNITAIGIAFCLAFTACKDGDDNTDQGNTGTTGVFNGDTMHGTPGSAVAATTDSAVLAEQNRSAGENLDPAKKATTGKAIKGKIGYKPYVRPTTDKMEADAEGVYGYAEIMPSFPGGEAALTKWLEENIEYPQEALDNDISGDVQLRFAVDETGKVYAAKVRNKIGYGLEEEAMRVVNMMPKWNPGRIKGKNVKTYFTLPVSFQIM